MTDLIETVARDDAASPATPRVSVVIVSQYEVDQLESMLRQRIERRDLGGVDTIVVTAARVDDGLAGAFSEIRFIAAPADSTVAHMRMLGVRHAAGDVVMLIDNLRDEAEVDAAFALHTADGAQLGATAARGESLAAHGNSHDVRRTRAASA